MEIVFATNNLHKLTEVRAALAPAFQVRSLEEIGFMADIPEPHDSLEANSLEKSRTIYRTYRLPCFADDTGLEVEALNGLPGVISAHYAGPQRSAEDNIAKLLAELELKDDRRARFRTVASLIIDGEEFLFEGTVNGTILPTPTGTGGFGYDPIFQPDGYAESFAQLPLAEKNRISHRGRAMQLLSEFLLKNYA